ncbi:MAG: response regulator transcription factor [Halochromatium sp.]|uniref:response regulator transcription factor n=1 Tax=Halochromatium sp. TaxID=2049430 RepID=UPI00397A3F85
MWLDPEARFESSGDGASLTPRERQVMRFATQGLSNKDIARELEISPRTVETHRAKMMEKMEADSIAMLCNMVALCPPGEEEATGLG